MNREFVKQIAIIILFSYLFLFHGLGSYSLKEPDEGRYAEIPREMVESGNYVVPYLNYARYFEKPPLLYWLDAISYKLFGVSEWSFRFPNAFSAFLMVLLLYLFVRRWLGSAVAFLSSLILLSSFGFFGMARVVTTDMLLAFWLFLGLISFYGYYREMRAYFLYLFYISLAMATLTKGPVALLLIAATLLLFLLTEGNVSFLKELASGKGLLLFVLLTLPWFVAISLSEREFPYFFFIDQHILRFLTTKHRRSGPPYYFIPVLFGGLFPWSIYLPAAILRLWRNSEIRLFLIWSAVVFLFFSLSGSKLPPYILPMFPTVSIVLGYFFHENWLNQTPAYRERVVYMVLFLIFGIAGAVFAGGFANAYIGAAFPDFASTASSLKGFAIALSVISAASILLLSFRRFTALSAQFILLFLFSASIMLTLLTHLPVVDRINTTKELSTIINRGNFPADYIVNYASFEDTLPFYTGKRIYLASYTGELDMGASYADARPFFITEADFVRLFDSDKKVLAVLRAKRVERLKQLGIHKMTILACQNEKCLIYNR